MTTNKNVLDTLYERGFIKQTVYEEDLRKLLASESISFYVGFDPTADSLHIGHYIPIMAMAHMQRAGHKPIALVGGGTAMVGDPSGRSDMREMMTKQEIANNCAAFKKQIGKFLSFEGDNSAVMVDNGDWLLGLNYVDFLRDIGIYFSVNKMITAECFKSRMKKGLSFLEFNYQLMQGYDFLVLYQKYGCVLQVGGNDQWNNILAGADLIRRKERKDAYALTVALLETSDGKKMGKTAKGALWLDASKTTPYEFYQYFRNIEDAKVEECFRLLTFLELDEIKSLCAYKDERINAAKERLAYETTALIHGKEAALEAQKQAMGAFSGNVDNMPVRNISSGTDLTIIDLLVLLGHSASKGEARKLIIGGGVKINDTKIESIEKTIADFTGEKEFVLHKGKKVHERIILE